MRDKLDRYADSYSERLLREREAAIAKTHVANIASANAAAQQRRNHQLVTGQLTPQQYGQQHNALSDLGKRHGIDVQGGLRRMATPASTAPQRQFDLPSVAAREHADLPRRAAAAAAVPGSLASGVDARGNRSYDNDSIRRMLARNGDADWQNYGRGSQPQAAAPQGGIARRAPGAVQMGGGPSTAVISANSAEKERQARISELKSEMFKLGSLNSRGKRAMWTAMQNEIGNLTGQRYDADTKRDMQRAEHQHNTAATNANLRDRAVDRQHRQDQFDASMAWDQQKHGDNMAMGLYERMLQQQEAAARSQVAMAQARVAQNKDARAAQMEQAKFVEGLMEKRREELSKRYPDASPDDLDRAAALDLARLGQDPAITHSGAAGVQSAKEGFARRVNDESRAGIGSYLGQVFRGEGFTPGDSGRIAPGETPDFNKYELERDQGLYGVAAKLGDILPFVDTSTAKRNTARIPTSDGTYVQTRLTDKEADDLRRWQRYEREQHEKNSNR